MALALVAAAGDGLIAIDRQGKVVVFNAAAGRIFGVEPESMIGQSLETLMVPGMFVEHQRYIQEFFLGQTRGVVGSTIETVGKRRDNTVVPVEISLSATTVESEPLVLASIRDITRRRLFDEENRQLMEQLTQAQKMEALGTLAAGIAHDFNNMLGAIMGYASTLTQELSASQQHLDDANQILLVVRRAKRLTDKLLAFSRRSDLDADVCSITQVVDDVVGLLSRTLPKNITIRTRLTSDLYTEGDRTQLEQVMLNLCLNSRDALPDGGAIRIETNALQPTGEPGDTGSSTLNRITVHDNGVGMDAETLQRVFDPFFSTKPTGEGSGLGLSLVYHTVKSHGGQVLVESEPGQGTTVTVCLPTTDRRPTAGVRAIASTSQRVKGNGELILLVDDERHLREMAKRLLEGLGYRVLLAESGEEAETHFRKQHAAIALVILDAVLVGLSGAETLVRLKEIEQEVRVLVSSGFSQDGVPSHLLRQGVCGFIQKPYGIEEVGQAIRKALAWTPPA